MKKSIFKLIGGLWCIVSSELASFDFRSCPGSTNVKTIGYSQALKQLFVEFQNNKRYIYDNAPQQTWDAFLGSLASEEPKVGSVLAQLVKGVLGYKEVSDYISIQASTPEAALKQMEALMYFHDTNCGLYAIDQDPEIVDLDWIRRNAFQIK